jgi:hypothetical protein
MRLASRLASPAVIAALAAGALAITAAPANAARHDPCATARATFRAHMNEARFWIGAADRLARRFSASSEALAGSVVLTVMVSPLSAESSMVS